MEILTQLKLFPQFSFDIGSSSASEHPDSNLIFLLDSLLHVMNLALPVRSAPEAKIIFNESLSNPRCIKESHLIILAASPSHWNQVAYQLAHEMCHYVILDHVPSSLQWLEESICELSSYYFLPRLTKYWRRKNPSAIVTKTGKPYYLEFERYAKNDQKKAVCFNLSNLTAIPPSDELQLLSANCELRDKNAYVANNLLPIFTKCPGTWHAIPFLGMLTPELPLSDSLKEWLAFAPPESREGLESVAQLFGATSLLS